MSATRLGALVRRLLLAPLVALAMLVTLLAAAPPSGAATAPRTPTGLRSAIEPLASYVGQVACDPRVRPGTLKLARLLVATYASGSWASTYACGTDGGQSEHYDGRAIDW